VCESFPKLTLREWSQVPNGPAKLEVLTGTMEAKLAEAGSRFASRHALDFQREAARCKTEIDAMQRELLNVKLEVQFIESSHF
jgi:hypothetical protein